MDILSKNRCKMLKILARREKRTSELVSDLGINKTAVSRHITRLKEDGLITKDGGRFRLTGKGKLLELFVRKLEETIEFVERHPDFWTSHDTEQIPESMKLRIWEIGDYTVLRGDRTNFLGNSSILASALKNVKLVRAVFSVVLPEFLTALAEISKHADVSIVVTEDVVKFLNEEITRNAGVFINNSVRLLCLSTDRKLCLALYYLNGEFDISSILVSDTLSAINWGLELFECFERSSTAKFI